MPHRSGWTSVQTQHSAWDYVGREDVQIQHTNASHLCGNLLGKTGLLNDSDRMTE
jgi:hypothetical protein